MRVPVSWLRELVPVGLGTDELVDVMSLHGLEVEAVHRPGAGLRGARTARVLERRPHPDADTLQDVRVTDGDDEVEVVCGAWNFAEGDTVVHAGSGGRLPDGTVLEARDIRGVTSQGMLCSARELDLGTDHSGIVVLDGDTPVGVPLDEVLPVGEPVIEVAVFANRGDHHSVLGIAREGAAILDLSVQRPGGAERPDGDAPPVTVEDPDGCPQFVAWGLDRPLPDPDAPSATPWWMRQRLEACGVRAISPIVDVTNYVMLELGQPLHAFDLDRLHGPELRARRAAERERLVTLDGEERTLDPGDMVVADADRAVAIGGVMGGADTEVGPDTTRVALEAATWDPPSVRRTARRLNLTSEASLRFARRVDPGVAEPALARAAALLEQITGAETRGASRDGGVDWDPAPVTMDAGWCAAFLGLDDLDADDQAGYLRREGCEVDVADGTLSVHAPSWRDDLTRPADLAEEVARLHGYDRVPATMPRVAVAGGRGASREAAGTVRRLCRAYGLSEVRTRPFVGTEPLMGLAPSDGRVRLANPLAQDASALRPTTVEGLLAAVRTNVGQGRHGLGVFEAGRVFRPAGDPLDDVLDAVPGGLDWRWRDPDGRTLPTQPLVLGLAAQGLRQGRRWLDTDRPWSVFDLLAVVDEVVGRVLPGGTRPERDQDVDRPGLHPGRTAVLRLDGVELGLVGRLHPEEAAARDLPEPVVVGEVLLEPLLARAGTATEPRRAPRLTHHPAVTVDVALVADEDEPDARLEDAVRAGAGDLLDGLWWFDEYRGEQVGEGRRSLALRLRLQAEEQLADDDAEAVIDAVAEAAGELGATLRR